MATKIIHKKSSVASRIPAAADLEPGEIAVNLADRKLYSKTTGGTVIELAPSTAFSGNLNFLDNEKAIFGAGSNLQIYFNGTHSLIEDTGSGDMKLRGSNLKLQDADGNDFIAMTDSGTGGTVELKNTGTTRLATTSTGIDVTGNTESDTITIGTSSVAGSEKLRVNGTVLTLGGSVTAPAIGIGDVNTGVYAPTAGQLGWTVNGTQRLFLDGTGIDVTGEITADGLTVEGTATTRPTIGNSDVNTSGLTTGLNFKPISNLSDGAKLNIISGLQPTVASAYTAGFEFVTQDHSGGGTFAQTKALTIGASGDISFYEDSGTNARMKWFAAEESLEIGAIQTGTNAPLSVKTNGSGHAISLEENAGAETWQIGVDNDGDLGFYNSGTATASVTFDDSGNLLVNRSSAFTTAKTEIQSDAGDPLTLALNSIDSDGNILSFYKAGSTVGSIGTLNRLTIGNASSGISFNSSTVAVQPHNMSTNLAANGTVSLGVSAARFKDLHLSGTVNANSVDLGSFVVTETNGHLYFSVNGVNKMKLDSSGNLQVVGNVDSNATIT